MLSELYTGGVLDAAAAIPPARRLDAPDASATKVSRVCGSEVTVDLVMKDGRVADFGMEAKACALGQASASIVARNIIAAEAQELYRLRDAMRAMLKENGEPPTGEGWDERWRDLAMLQPIRDYPQRHASTLLVFEAVCACLDQLGYDQPTD
ncbi:iron-sulfur cluster assembly scaffold protein [Marinicaulis aureus]|uniref:Iron-sulfur cluster assembly scaffold protein n=1 Tax=Hyphococcus aureus TaxID=2666033 RepID=A0ABW1KUY3_9PROT